MKEPVQAGLRKRRRAQLAGWTSLVGIVACFLMLLLLEQQYEHRAAMIRGALIICLTAHFAIIAYLRFARCPACGERFVGTTARGFGSFTALSQEQCDHCGVTLASRPIR